MVLLTSGNLEDLIPKAGESPDDGSELPGLSITSLTILDAHEMFGGKAEIYLFGIAIDGSKEIRIIPFGIKELQEGTNALAIQRMRKDETYAYNLGQGNPLVFPPVRQFLALRLMVVDTDKKVVEIAPLIKSAGELMGSKEAIGALTLTGMPQAAAIATVLGKGVEVIASAMEKNRDDLIGIFQGYFGLADTVHDITASADDAVATFHWLRS